jgi:hypothetical protein
MPAIGSETKLFKAENSTSLPVGLKLVKKPIGFGRV